MKFPTISQPLSLLGAILFATAIMVGRSSPHVAETASEIGRPATIEPQAVLIETGSVEHRLRTMETQLVELRNRVRSLEGAD